MNLDSDNSDNYSDVDARLAHIRPEDLNEPFSNEDFQSIKAGCASYSKARRSPWSLSLLRNFLIRKWEPLTIELFSRAIRPSKPAAPSPPPPEEKWLFSMSAQFISDVVCIDRKLQGRILEALTDLSNEPLQPRGDTVKPLTGEKKHLWRYRLGNFRIVYLPDAIERCVTLISFAPRGKVYD